MPPTREASALAAALERAGMPHELQIAEDMSHGFLQLFQLEGCETGWRLIVDFIRCRA